MVKKLSIWFVLVLLLGFSNGITQEDFTGGCSIDDGNIFNNAFKIPFEMCYIIFYNGDMLSITSYLKENVIFVPNFKEIVEEYNAHKISDIAIFIHNHMKPLPFSIADKRVYRNLKRYGFTGSFLLRYPSGKIIRFKEK